MSRSNKEARKEKKLKYASARGRAEKKQREASFSATYLKIPSGVKMFKPKEGAMLLDILPFRAGENNPCAEPGLLHYERTYHLHARVGADGGSPYLCPRLTSKSPCPICEHRQHLLKKSDPEDEKMIKDMAPKERQLFNVINLKEPDKGVQIWDMSYHLFGKLLDARIRNSDEDDGWDQFAALEGGLTLKVTFKEKSFGGRNFLEAETIDFKPRAEDYDDEVLEQTHCLDELLIEPEYDELKEVFLEAASTDDDEDEKPLKKKKHVEAEEDEDEDEEETPPAKHKKKAPVDEDEEDEDDEEEEPTPKKKSKPAPPDDDEDEDEDEDDEDEPVAKSKKPAKKNFDDFDEDDEDDEEEPVKSKKKPAPAEDEDDEEDDEEEDEPPAKSTYKRPSRAKKKPEPEDDDEDEEDDEDEDPPRVKQGKVKKPNDDEEEEDDDEED